MHESKLRSQSRIATVLVSGGIDSAGCLAFYLEHGSSVRGVFVDYGQPAARCEANAAQALANHYRIPLTRLAWLASSIKGAGLIRGRNAFLLISALMELPEPAGIVAIGIHSGTQYVDCSPSFLREIQSVFDAYMKGTVQIGAPFLTWTKRDVWRYCKTRGVPLELTYSCERGVKQPCGRCLSCRDLEALHACA